ncbi:uncharacterized protein SAMN05192559_101361 [Halobacillus karajensis]|uniref:ATP-dependent sacrificial sulfur transferase LarE n=1 Tax=Halobacillus karajensis TaxID=195088 RepID=UPI0008A7D2CF|nr:ATP-dependent sacrificial sulfur transferase LarE [Halobacillus karajensis]SEH43292.1 uncharacterized protein SAMN05192559_101361 [Halobacillus karajensis]
MNETLSDKNRYLSDILSGMNRVLVAFSGGVDSSLVLKRAQQELGSSNVLAVVVASELFRKEEFEGAIHLAIDMGAHVHKTEINELDVEEIASNNPDSWYYSKKMLYKHLNQLADEWGYDYVLDGMIMDDLKDFRPGLKARNELGIRSVLEESNMYKDEVRELSKHLELPVWDKPASCSLASRIPYGTRLDKEKIKQVDQAERFVAQLGFDPVRIRHHGSIARIEVMPEKIEELLIYRGQIQAELQSIGFKYVSIDLEGYRTGSMNEVLEEKSIDKVVS